MNISKKRCIAITKKNFRCTKNQAENTHNMCKQHFTKYYISKNNKNLEIEEHTCSICLEKNNMTYIKSVCCNYWFHYNCLETHLSYYCDKMFCPCCRYEYKNKDILNLLSVYQIKLLDNRIFQDIRDKLSMYRNLFNKFQFNLNEIETLEKIIKNKKDLLITIYKNNCINQCKIDNQINKNRLISNNITESAYIKSELYENRNYMLDKLDI